MLGFCWPSGFAVCFAYLVAVGNIMLMRGDPLGKVFVNGLEYSLGVGNETCDVPCFHRVHAVLYAFDRDGRSAIR